MASTDEQKLRKALRLRAFESVYYLYGDEELLKEEGVRALLDAAVAPETRDFNLDARSGSALDAESLASLLATPPMMAERRAVVVREASALKKDARAALDRYVQNPASDVLLVLVEPGGERGKPDKTLAALPGALQFKPLTGDRVPKWIAHHAQAVHNAAIAPDAADLLLSAIGSDLPALAAELDKLASYTSGAMIDEAAVAAVVGVRRGETMGDLLGRIAHRDTAGALAMLGYVLEQPKVSGVQIVMALTTQMLAMGWADSALRRGLPRARLYPELFDLLKRSGGPYTGMPWGEAVKIWNSAVSRWDAGAIDRALATLLAADGALKETTVSTDEQILTTVVLEMCG